MTKEAAVLGGMVFGQRGHPVRIVAFLAEFLCFLLVHLHEFCVVIIVGQVFSCFFRCTPEKEKKPPTDDNKDQVVNENVFALGFLFLRVHVLFLVQSAISSMLKGMNPTRSARISISMVTILTSLFLAENSTMR